MGFGELMASHRDIVSDRGLAAIVDHRDVADQRPLAGVALPGSRPEREGVRAACCSQRPVSPAPLADLQVGEGVETLGVGISLSPGCLLAGVFIRRRDSSVAADLVRNLTEPTLIARIRRWSGTGARAAISGFRPRRARYRGMGGDVNPIAFRKAYSNSATALSLSECAIDRSN